MTMMRIPQFLVLVGTAQAFVPHTSPLVRYHAATPPLVAPLFVGEVETIEAVDEEQTAVLATPPMMNATTAAQVTVKELVDEECALDDDLEPADEFCAANETTQTAAMERLERSIQRTLQVVQSEGEMDEDSIILEEMQDPGIETFLQAKKTTEPSRRRRFWNGLLTTLRLKKKQEPVDLSQLTEGEILERGWDERANSAAIVRNAEVWKFGLQCVFKALQPRKLRKKGASEDEITAAQVAAAEFIRDGLLKLGPSFVKLGQVASTRTDVLPKTYTDVLKTLTDAVPAFDGARAQAFVQESLGTKAKELTNFSKEPLKAASLGQVHTALYKGKKVAVKVQRSKLQELFDVDLKNLEKLAALLDKFDPKSDGADRNWVEIYNESARLLYLEIDYLNEAANAVRFANDFRDIDWVRVPQVYPEVSTKQVLTMEFVESFKLTNTQRVDELSLDRKLLSKRVADAFLRQIIETAYFHADPHSGNLCVNEEGNLVYYDVREEKCRPVVLSPLFLTCTVWSNGRTQTQRSSRTTYLLYGPLCRWTANFRYRFGQECQTIGNGRRTSRCLEQGCRPLGRRKVGPVLYAFLQGCAIGQIAG